MGELDDVGLAENPEQRCPCLLLLDTSSSMAGNPITALNDGIQSFQGDLHDDSLALKRVEVAIITFGGTVATAQDWIIANDFVAPLLTAQGGTPMGEAIHRGIDFVTQRKDAYRANDVDYLRPWIFLLTDGGPTDEWQSAAQRVKDGEAQGSFAFYGVGVGAANMETLGQIATRHPVKIEGLKFREFFLWLSKSQRAKSRSRPGVQTPMEPRDDWEDAP